MATASMQYDAVPLRQNYAAVFPAKYAPTNRPALLRDVLGVPARPQPVVEWTRELYREAVRDLAPFMSPLVASLGRSERRVAAVQYVGGLLVPGWRKRIRPLAEWLGIDHQRLQQFLTDSPWNDEPVWSAIRRRLLSQLDSVDLWLVGLRAWGKQGKHSVGVSYQASNLRRKKTNCQVSVELLLGRNSLSAPIAGRLYLSEPWSGNTELRRRVGVPPDVDKKSAPALGVRLIRSALDDTVPKAPVVADSTFGDNSEFRGSLRALGVEYFLEIDPYKNWCCEDAPDRSQSSPMPVDQLINRASIEDWEHIYFPQGDQRNARILWRRILLVPESGPPERCWLAVEWPKGARTYYRAHVASLDREPEPALFSALATAPECLGSHERCFERILELDNYQGRSWSGFHHHLVLAAAACVFVFLKTLDRYGLRVREAPKPDPLIESEALRMAALI
jgi:SRSO17 transposase